MMEKQPDQLQVINKIIQLAEINSEVDVLWLYGSRARNNATNRSDYDLAIAFTPYLKDPLERRLRPEMLALEWQKQLDHSAELSIIDINQAPLPLAYTVIQDNTTLYSQNEFRRMTEEQRIMSKWELDYLYHRKHYA